MTIDAKTKEPLLRHFDEKMEIDGWTFNDSGPNEKDRDVLVHFDDIIFELKRTKEPYYKIIKDITIKMGNGMADYALNAEFNANGVDTVEEYELYCHYVAGLVGEGLTRLFVESKLANPQLMVRTDLSESMGQFLQKTNIIRDVHEDFLDKRRFWPKAVWSKHFENWDDMFLPENREKAMHVSSEMVLNALKNGEDCLFYMAGIRDQSVFNFVAIPQSMAIATLELVFRNPAIFHSHLKITKGDACQLMTESTQNLRVVCDVFRRYVRRIHQKNDPTDPSYFAISAQGGKACIPPPSQVALGALPLTTPCRLSNSSSLSSPHKMARSSLPPSLARSQRSPAWTHPRRSSLSAPSSSSCLLLVV